MTETEIPSQYEKLQVAPDENDEKRELTWKIPVACAFLLTACVCFFGGLYVAGTDIGELNLHADKSCCLFESQCIGDDWCNASKDRCLGACNAHNDKNWGLPGSPQSGSSLCGYAVDTGAGECDNAARLVGETMSCFAYGGRGDPCSLNCNNDPNQGMDKDPSQCMGTEFFLWDEPDTQGFSYAWAGQKWQEYARRWSNQLAELRNRGVQIIAPAVKNDNPGGNIDAFMQACPSCLMEGNPAKIDGFASNVFVGSWNHGNIAAGIEWSLNLFKPISAKYRNMPFYITNWGYLGTSNPDDQVAAMRATSSFFAPDSPVMKVFYFAARDYGGNTKNNGFGVYSSNAGTLGTAWRQTCSALDSQ